MKGNVLVIIVVAIVLIAVVAIIFAVMMTFKSDQQALGQLTTIGQTIIGQSS